MATRQQPWAVVVPVKRLAYAKTRLALPPVDRARLALATAEDTIRACVAADVVSRVVVVTDDEEGAARAVAAGALVVADEPDAGLNPALRHGAMQAAIDARIATVSSDLPSLRAADLDAALRAAVPYACAIVADAAGTGTVLYAAASVADFQPAYGGRSRVAHISAGAVDITDAAKPRLRRDVDTIADLASAWDLGVGPVTRRTVKSLGGIAALVAAAG
jgi:2-phospho-L-lactate/phosphoenolpyruvate guanylyltransferase